MFGIPLAALGAALLIMFLYLFSVGATFYQATNPTGPYTAKHNSVTFAYSYFLNQTFGVEIVNDFRIGFTLHYNGTLTAGTPILVTANASEHSAESYNATAINIRFQDSLAYPNYRVDSQNVPVDGAVLLTTNGIHFLKGSGKIFFPLAGSYSPIIGIIQNETIKGTHDNQTHFLVPRIVNDISVLVQPSSRIDDEIIANDNLKLTFGLYVIEIVTFGAACVTVLKESMKYLRDR